MHISAERYCEENCQFWREQRKFLNKPIGNIDRRRRQNFCPAIASVLTLGFAKAVEMQLQVQGTKAPQAQLDKLPPGVRRFEAMTDAVKNEYMKEASICAQNLIENGANHTSLEVVSTVSVRDIADRFKAVLDEGITSS